MNTVSERLNSLVIVCFWDWDRETPGGMWTIARGFPRNLVVVKTSRVTKSSSIVPELEPEFWQTVSTM